MPYRRARIICRIGRVWGVVIALAAGLARAEPADVATVPADDAAGREAVAFFETSVRPLLAENCYGCHGPDKQKGGLRLDSRAAMLAGGETGPALAPAEPGQSKIVRAVGYEDPDLRMPPKKRLSSEQVKTLARWVAMGGAVAGNWRRESSETATTAPAAPVRADARPVTDADRLHWSFQPMRDPGVPAVSDPAWVATAIDAFVLAKLDERGLKPNPPAEKRELLRRAAFDLTGLPPTAEECERFLTDESPDAWQHAVDRLLASPRYGERWARHWLDVVRYAQTEGYERDGEKPYAWRYRDYVIGAFNADKPYDRFVKEQLAGDELDVVTDESLIATGFYRLGVVDDEPDDKLGAEYDYLDDSLRTMGAAFLGLTVGCARCHDHKFDPIPQADYYRLLAFVRNVRMHERPRYTRDSATYAPLAAARDQVGRWYADREAEVAPLRQKIESILAPARAELVRQGVAEPDEDRVVKSLAGEPAAEHARLLQQVREIEKREPPFDEWALAVREHGPAPAKTHVLVRGSAASPGAAVQPAFLEVLGGGQPAIVPRSSEHASSGLRRALAEWLVRPDHPLTARVMVNRVWQHHFGGRGIVPTPDDFGKTGVAPTHPELLDWLAARFVEGGWSVKRLHKLILASSAYRMSSRAGSNPAAAEADPGNGLLWRQNMRRLEAEAIRDSVLAVCGTLDATTGGRGFFPRLDREAIASGSRPGDGWDVSPPAARNRRSIYAYLKRSQLVPMLETFDFNNTAMPSGERASTIVSPQALMLLNDDFMHEQADALARSLIAAAPGDRRRQLELAYARTLGRAATAGELAIASGYVARQAEAFTAAAHTMTFRPQVPGALFAPYLAKLAESDLLAGPKSGSRYGRGAWGGEYEKIVNLDPARGPFALAEATTFADGIVDARLRLHPGVELGGLILRGKLADATSHLGYDVVLDARNGAVLLRKHAADKVTVLASAPADVRTGDWHQLRVTAAGPRIAVWLDGAAAPLLSVTDEAAPVLEPGHVGVRVWGAAMDVDRLTVFNEAGGTTPVAEGLDDPGRAERQALASFCLVLLNLNEFVYVD